MKLTVHCTLLALFLGAGVLSVTAQNEFLVTIDDVLRDPTMRPREVLLKKRTPIKIGAGSVVYEVGTRLMISRMDRDYVYVQLAGQEFPILLVDTNLLEVANASFSVARARQKLLEEASALPPIPEPSPTPGSTTGGTNPALDTTVNAPPGLFSDEFPDISSLARWKRVSQTEGWNIDVMESLTVGRYGLTMIPYTSGWLNEYRGELFYQPVDGDFVIETLVGVSSRNNPSALPSSPFSLAGLMLRVHRDITPATRKPQGETYIFLGIGVGADTTAPTLDIKITSGSSSQITPKPCPQSAAYLMLAKVGDRCFLLAKPVGTAQWNLLLMVKPWPDAKSQAGFTACTDGPGMEMAGVERHNSSVLRTGNPDLRATFAYVRCWRPEVTPELAAKLSTDGAMTDQEIIDFFTTQKRR